MANPRARNRNRSPERKLIDAAEQRLRDADREVAELAGALETATRTIVALVAAYHADPLTLTTAMADVRLPLATGNLRRGERWMREVANRQRLSVARTRDGYALTPYPAGAAVGDDTQPTPED